MPSALLILYSAIMALFLENMLMKKPEVSDKIDAIIANVLSDGGNGMVFKSCEDFKEQNERFNSELNTANVFRLLKEYRNGLSNQAQYLNNVVSMIETFLLFLRATRQQLELWMLR